MTNHQVSGISIVIPTYNRARLLGPTLNSVKSLRLPEGLPIELLVIDNMCTDETAHIVEQAAKESPFPISRTVEQQQGLCFGRNRGLKDAQYSEVIFLDDDIEIAPDWLIGYVQAVNDLDADCVVGPVKPEFEVDVPKILTPRVLESISSSYSCKGDREHLLNSKNAHEIPGCNFGVRKMVGLEIGGFNNSLDRVGGGLLAGGDTEFGMRLNAAGKRVVYQPLCAIRHIITEEKFSRDYLRKRWIGTGRTQQILERLHGSPPGPHRRARLLLRAIQFQLRSWRYRMLGNAPLGFQYELEARKLLTYLRRV